MLAADDGEPPLQAGGRGTGHAFSRPGWWASRYSQPSASPSRTSARAPCSQDPGGSPDRPHLCTWAMGAQEGQRPRRTADLARRPWPAVFTLRGERSRGW